jgi:hypothetical protein
MGYLCLRELCYGKQEAFSRICRWETLSMRPRWETWKRTHVLGAFVWKNVLGVVSLPVGYLLGNLGRWSRLPGSLRIR